MKENKASSTAYTVLQGLIYTGRKPEFAHLLSSEAMEIGTHILQHSETGRTRLKQIDSGLWKALLPMMEKLLLPGISLHYALRKAYIERQVRKAIAAGASQFINLGAGFDTLAARLAAENENINCIEIDHPATHSEKKSAIQGSDFDRPNLHFLPIDFTTQTLSEELGSFEGFDCEKPTVCVIEGVLMYLTEVQIFDLLSSISILIKNPYCHLVFTAVEPPANHPDSYGPLLKLYLKFKNEPLNWLCQETDLSKFLEPSDFTLTETASGDVLRQQFLPDYLGPVHKGEFGADAICNTKIESS